MEQILLKIIDLEELIDRIGKLLDNKLQSSIPFPSETPDTYLSRSEVAKLLKISLPTLNDWTKAEYLNAYKLGGRVLYRLDEVKQALEKVSNRKHKKNGL